MKLFYFIAGKFSYTFAVTLFVTVFGIIEILLSYIISATYITFSFEKIQGIFIQRFPYVLLAVTVIFFIISGFLAPVKIPAFLKRYRKINNTFKQKMDVEIQSLKETYADFSDFVIIATTLSFFFIFITGAGMTGICLYTFRITGGITLPELKIMLKIILIASVIAIILFGMTTLILTEYLTYKERSDLYIEIVKNGEIMKPYSLYNVSVYFLFYAFLLIIILFTFTGQFEKLKFFSKSNIIIFSYILGSILCVFYVAMIHTKSIRRVLNDLSKVTEGLVSGRREGFRYLSLCREFSLAQHSLMLTGREMDLSRKNLELLILERTDELEKALDTARHKDDQFKKQFDTTGIIRDNILLSKIEDWNEIKFSISHKKVRKHGGDYYNFYQKSENKILILIADVQANDIHASIMTIMLEVFSRAAVGNSDSPGKMLQEINYNIVSHLKTGNNADFFIVAIDDNYNITYSGAGNIKPVITRNDSLDVEILDTGNKAIASDDRSIISFKEEVTKLGYGDRLILFTDGIILTGNFDKEEYSQERFNKSIIDNRELDTDAFTDALIRDLNNYKGSSEPSDDISLIIIEPIQNETVEIIKSSKKLIDNFKYIEAVELLENSLEKYPENLKILYHLGKNYFRVDNYNAALQVLEKYLETDNNNKYVFYVIGACYYQNMDFRKAIENFNSAISIDPFFTPALFALGMSYKNVGDYDIATEIFNKVSEIDTDNKMSLYEIGQIEKLKSESASLND